MLHPPPPLLTHMRLHLHLLLRMTAMLRHPQQRPQQHQRLTLHLPRLHPPAQRMMLTALHLRRLHRTQTRTKMPTPQRPHQRQRVASA